ncbi:ribonuclease III domain-containing protein [Blattabacterium cuenoti]|uniref:ribonuclease III domain-containing protein n=1 Tax=Blattabacterium cuenoti TaxID=1653831 RepID=UPI00163C5D78|nr:ribonuclease III domain-containing protein [Blattabacterium cuenoti]
MNKNYIKIHSVIDQINKILGFKIKRNILLLKEAFIYNFSTKKRNINKYYSINFQRLEFLGDSILNTIISHFLYKNLPNKKEGDLTKIRSKIVCRKNLNVISKKLSLEKIFFPKDNLVNNNVLGNILEALIGFTYLETGSIGCKNFIYKKILYEVDINKLQNEISSYKVWIMEWCQKNKFFINFNTFLEKKDKKNNKVIFLSIFDIYKCNIQSIGRGYSKKKSEEMAAKNAYYIINKKHIEKKNNNIV